MPRRPWKILGVLSVSILGFVGASGVWVQLRIQSRSAQMGRRLSELRLRALAVSPARQVLWGESIPGNAWDDYDLPMRSAQGFIPQSSLPFVQHAKELAPLRKGAHRDFSRVDIDKSSAVKAGLDLAWRGGYFLTMFRAEASRERKAGRLRQSCEVFLDALQVYRDLELLESLGSVLDELRELAYSDDPEKAELEFLGEGLKRLDESFPKGRDRGLRGIYWAYLGYPEIPNNLTIRTGSLLWPGAWRWLFSYRLTAADAVDQSCSHFEALPDWDGPWAEVRVRLGQADRDLNEARNRLVEHDLMWEAAEQELRQARAKIRLLRIAFHFRSRGEVLVLPDPFGTELHAVAKDGLLKLWSNGPDGVDDTGMGAWSMEGRDIVLSGIPDRR